MNALMARNSKRVHAKLYVVRVPGVESQPELTIVFPTIIDEKTGRQVAVGVADGSMVRRSIAWTDYWTASGRLNVEVHEVCMSATTASKIERWAKAADGTMVRIFERMVRQAYKN
jgi:hypothetical protein